ncbi:MAG TPA: glycosyltransferase [Candidatus Nitrosocosmicus sp.]|nr:glycosyltransferase [Candidatus Nitrosocosmicus sp.]
MLKASVIIPTFNRPTFAIKLAENIRKYHSTSEIEILIIDQMNSSNLSKDDENMVGFKLYNLDQVSTSKAKNVGISKAKAPILIFFDDDVEIDNQTIQQHLLSYKEHIIGVAGRVINDDEKIPENTEVETGHTDSLGTSFSMRFWSTKEQEVDFVYGCNMSYKKDIIEKLSGFDEQFLPPLCAFEEVDLSIRAKKYGKILFNPKSIVLHHRAKKGGTRTDTESKAKLYYHSYGRYLAKNIPFPLSLLSLFRKTLTVLKENPYAIVSFYSGYFKYET